MTIAPLSIATFPIAPCLGGSKGNLSPATGILLNQGNMAQVVTDLTNPRCIVGTVHQIVKVCHLSPPPPRFSSLGSRTGCHEGKLRK